MSPTADISSVLSAIDMSTESEYVGNTYNNTHFKGFSGSFTAEEVNTLSSIAEVSIVDSVVSVSVRATRSSVPWGLERISQTKTITNTAAVSSLAYTYTYSDTSLGSGVDIYIVDTGIRTTHEQFDDRATMGYSYYTSNTDDYGHGTHVSGTSAGNTVGVASEANLIGVKVLDSSGSGTSSGLISGIDYVVSQHESRSSASDFVGSVVSMSLGFSGRSTAVETALLSMSSSGIHAAVAAGNDDDDACDYTPGSLGGTNSDIVSVGAMTIADEVAYFSNSGSCVDLYAPGYTVYSSYYNSDTSYAWASGTSMATPHVSGLIAYLLAGDSSLNTPAAMKAYLTSTAISGYLVAGSADLVSGGELIIANNGETGTNATYVMATKQSLGDLVDAGLFV
ncbi:subtilisin-like protein [Saccharata proteae CBS 121410]|uniref:Subtilisin-like protein n=1 Tax=Saccharata proteae CBS 121410 TaxID=1314787 RepID=A0A9P4I363_9PEZI|nr:subtilisin-like protein [Saccharata proteae CBS 121410]